MEHKYENQTLLPRRLPFWQDLDEDDRARLIERSTVRLFKKGEIVHNCTGECLGYIVVLRGNLCVCMVSEEGREMTLFSLWNGDSCVFGSACVLRPVTCHSHLSAEVDTEVLMIPHMTWEDLLRRNIRVECYAHKLAERLLSNVLGTVQQMLFWDFDTRLAHYLVSESERVASPRIRTTHEKIARSTGSAREVVSRMLKKFAEMGLVEVHRGAIVICDMAALKAMIPRPCD